MAMLLMPPFSRLPSSLCDHLILFGLTSLTCSHPPLFSWGDSFLWNEVVEDDFTLFTHLYFTTNMYSFTNQKNIFLFWIKTNLGKCFGKHKEEKFGKCLWFSLKSKHTTMVCIHTMTSGINLCVKTKHDKNYQKEK